MINPDQSHPDDVVSQTEKHLRDLLATVEVLDGNMAYVHGQDEFLALVDQQKLKVPAVGIVYAGMFKQKHKHGYSPLMRWDLWMLGFDTCEFLGAEVINRHTHIMFLVRKLLIRQRSPTGHFWNFEREIPLAVDNHSGYLQSWSSSAPLTTVK